MLSDKLNEYGAAWTAVWMTTSLAAINHGVMAVNGGTGLFAQFGLPTSPVYLAVGAAGVAALAQDLGFVDT